MVIGYVAVPACIYGNCLCQSEMLIFNTRPAFASATVDYEKYATAHH